MKVLASAIVISALWIIALSMWQISADVHELRWTLIAATRQASR
jgi:hypothetical protein